MGAFAVPTVMTSGTGDESSQAAIIAQIWMMSVRLGVTLLHGGH